MLMFIIIIIIIIIIIVVVVVVVIVTIIIIIIIISFIISKPKQIKRRTLRRSAEHIFIVSAAIRFYNFLQIECPTVKDFRPTPYMGFKL